MLNDANTFSGGAVVASSGTAQVGNNAAFGAGTVIVNGAIDLAGFSPTIGGLSGPAGGLIANLSGTTNSTLTVSQTGSSTFAGTIADDNLMNTTAFTLTGPGTLYLTGTNTYSGGTTVSGGAELIVTNNEALADGSSLFVGNALSSFSQLAAAAARGQPDALSPAAAVPEPGTLALLAAAALAGGAAYRRGARTKKALARRRR